MYSSLTVSEWPILAIADMRGTITPVSHKRGLSDKVRTAACVFWGLFAVANITTFSKHTRLTQRGCSPILPTDRGADKSLARPTSRCILFDGENISFDASLVIYINSINIPPIMIINRIYENQNLLSL